MTERLSDLHALSLQQRMAKQLLRLERTFGVDISRGPSIALQVSQSDLGELVGEGIVRVAQAGVQILAHDVLRARAAPL
jgi:CRP-like cAMP-binding protein